MTETAPQPPVASADHFLGYFMEHPLVETQRVQLVLGAALIEQLVEQGPVEPKGYGLLVHQILADHQTGTDYLGGTVPSVVQDGLRALLYRTEMVGWSRKAVGDEFADQVFNYFDQAEEAAGRSSI